MSTTYLKDYRSYPFLLLTVTLQVDLFDDYALVQNKMCFERLQPGALSLNGADFELISMSLDDQTLDLQPSTPGIWTVNPDKDKFTLTVKTRLRPQDNTQLSGLYRSNGLFCTQCEAEGFRRITLFPDRPDVLSLYTTRISADQKKYPILLSNGNLVAEGSTDDRRHWAEWNDPFKKPSYLFALVAGDLACVEDQFVTRSGKCVALKLYVEPKNANQCDHALTSLKKAMHWDEEIYGCEYDLDLYMIVAVSDFNMGAMENKGLNIFNAKCVLANPATATDQDYAMIEGVIAHEYFHNWTGNRVTCRDWFQLSLKEGLTVFRDQEFSRDMNSRDVNRIYDVNDLRQSQFPEDAGRMAHPVRPNSYQEISNFYTATIYNKGAEVIRMQHTLLGATGFRHGMDLYFKRHDGCAVTIEDFVAAMEDANNLDLTQFKLWYEQAGTPEVQVKSTYNNHKLTLTLTQTCPETTDSHVKQPFHIPLKIALWTSSGAKMPISSEILELRAAEQTFTFDGLSERPVVSLLRDFSAPIKLHPYLADDDLLLLLKFETNGFSQWDSAQQLAHKYLITAYNNHDISRKIPDALTQAYSTILSDTDRDPALRAALLTTPGFEAMAGMLVEIDVTRVEDAREMFIADLGRTLYNQLDRTYQLLWSQEDHSMQSSAYGIRALRNTCLRLMMAANESKATDYCQNQFQQAQTMTDQIASLNLLVNHTQQVTRLQAIQDFYQRWQDNQLVLDKWFTVQATANTPDVLTQVKELLVHPAFNLQNPNNARALIGGFVHGNPRYFHAINGSGYSFLTDMLIEIDSKNPQCSARLASPLTQWQRWDPVRQGLMLQQLHRLQSLRLSPDLSEIVEKSLA